MKRQTLSAGVILLLFLIAVLAGCAHEPDFVGTVLTTAEVKSGGRASVEIPFETLTGTPVVVAELENLGPRYFIYDTGSSLNIVTDALIQDIGRGPKAVHMIRGKEDRLGAEVFALPPVRIGDVVLNRVVAYRGHRTDVEELLIEKGSAAGGLLAWNVFRNYMITVDYGRKKIILKTPLPPADHYRLESPCFEYGDFGKEMSHMRTLTAIVTNESYLCKTEGGEEVVYLPFVWRSDKVTIPVRIEGIDKDLLFFLDTGSSLNWVRHDLLDFEKLTDSEKVVGKASTTRGTKDIDTVSAPFSLQIGKPIQIRTREVLVIHKEDDFYAERPLSERVDGILGAPFLSKYVVTIDRRNRMVVLRPLESGPADTIQ